jgi:hypothetical protein
VCREPGAHLIRNLQTTKHLQNIIYINSEVGIPILRSQTDDIIDMGHGHQSYTVDPCRQNIAVTGIHCESMREISNQDGIATRHTQWIYVLQIIHNPLQPGTQR